MERSYMFICGPASGRKFNLDARREELYIPAHPEELFSDAWVGQTEPDRNESFDVVRYVKTEIYIASDSLGFKSGYIFVPSGICSSLIFEEANQNGINLYECIQIQ